ncbi:MAG: hypothetical protein E3J66_00890 [Dehalococcoidia bacterium]|nr:MAG: hypothetical protein E3J66_00890 [Dehalococcoidia bacterium]
MKRSAIHRKPAPPIPQESRLAVWDRAEGKCEWCGCSTWLQFAHIKHRGLGGRHGKMLEAIHDKRNIALLCLYNHDVLDRRVWAPELRERMLVFLKDKLGWHSWAEEYGIKSP